MKTPPRPYVSIYNRITGKHIATCNPNVAPTIGRDQVSFTVKAQNQKQATRIGRAEYRAFAIRSLSSSFAHKINTNGGAEYISVSQNYVAVKMAGRPYGLYTITPASVARLQRVIAHEVSFGRMLIMPWDDGQVGYIAYRTSNP